MHLNELNREELSALYRSQMTRDFPPQELKPLKSMLELMEEGRYQALGLFDGDELLGYALVWREPGVPFALLDYLGTLPGVRNRGLGGQMLDRLADYYREERGIFGEAESDRRGRPRRPGAAPSAAGLLSAQRVPLRRDTTAPSSASTTRPSSGEGGREPGGAAGGPPPLLPKPVPRPHLRAICPAAPGPWGDPQPAGELDGGVIP